MQVRYLQGDCNQPALRVSPEGGSHESSSAHRVDGGAWRLGKRLQVEVKDVQTELAEISRLNAEHEEANALLQKDLEELEVLEE